MDYKLLLDTAVLAGEVMLKSGAETYRVEDTMERMLSVADVKTTQVFVLTTGLIATLDDPAMDSLTVVRRIRERSMNLERIHKINAISREFCNKKIDLETAFHKIRDISREKEIPQPLIWQTIAVTAGFTVMFGGNAWDTLVAAAAGLFCAMGLYVCKKLEMHMFLANIIGALLLSVIAHIGVQVIPAAFHLDTIIIGSIMPLVPGVAITLAVLDTLHGDYVSGAARILEAFLVAVAVVIGVALGMAFCQVW